MSAPLVLFRGWGTAVDMENVRFRAATCFLGSEEDVTIDSDCDPPRGRVNLCEVDAWILGADSLRFKPEISTTRLLDPEALIPVIELFVTSSLAPKDSLALSIGSSIAIQKSSS